MSEQDVKFSEILKSLLAEKKITMAELARSIKVSRELISQYCKGNVIPKSDMLIKMAKFFDVSPEYLLTGFDASNEIEHKDLGLSGTAIRLLKKCGPNLLNMIDEMLSDVRFYDAVASFYDSMDSAGNYIVNEFQDAKGKVSYTKLDTLEKKLNSFLMIEPRALARYFEFFALKHTEIGAAKKLIQNKLDEYEVAARALVTEKATPVSSIKAGND